jgi:hypothetical protein
MGKFHEPASFSAWRISGLVPRQFAKTIGKPAILCPAAHPPNLRNQNLGFAEELDRDLAALAQEWQISEATLRQVLQVQALPMRDPKRWQRDVALREALRGRYHGVCADVQELSDRVARASSLVENLNSRLRAYFFLRRQLGTDYLTLLQFFLNHRRYMRSEDSRRVKKSPAELLTGKTHVHWLELLGYTRFSRN